MTQSLLYILLIKAKDHNVKIVKMQSPYKAVLDLMLYAFLIESNNARHNQVFLASACGIGAELFNQSQEFLTVRYQFFSDTAEEERTSSNTYFI